MDSTQALKTLGLQPGADAQAIKAAYQAKKQQLADKHQSAPTEALKQKLATMQASVEQAYKHLSAENSADNKTASSPLSATKMADLPGAGPTDTNNSINLQPGTVLAGRYTIEEQIGQGGMGAVYRAQDSNTGNPIALKVLLPALLKNERAKQRFLDEARISQQLSHPNIVNVYDVQHQGDYHFLTMELLQGQDLRQLMENRKLARQPFTTDDVKEIISAVSNGLAYAHQHTVHRDIKPENIWLTEQGDYKIMDFGIARVQSTSQRTQTGAAMGTAYYMAPEQLKGQSDIDGRADQYALAVLAYELLSGEVPAGMIEPIQQHRKDVPKGMAAAIHQGLSPKPENRFANITAFNTAIHTAKGRAPQLPLKPIGIAAALLLATLGATQLDWGNIVEALKPVDREAIAKAEADAKAKKDKADATAKAQLAKLQGEIKNYQRRLDNGQRQLASDLRDAERNNSKSTKYLRHWQTLTDNYLFAGDLITELEGNLSAGEELKRSGDFEQSNLTLTQVRDGYKQTWAEFQAAEQLLKAEEANNAAKTRWQTRKRNYGVANASAEQQAGQAQTNATNSQQAGALSDAVGHWQQAQSHWQSAYQTASGEVAKIDKQRAQTKAERARLARAKAVKQAALDYYRQAQTAAERGQSAKVSELQTLANRSDSTATNNAQWDKLRIAAKAKAAKIEMLVGQLVAVPAGNFRMGDLNGDGDSSAIPVHRVSVKAFKIMAHEVTFTQWDACVQAGGCSYRPDDEGWGRGSRPVIGVSHTHIVEQFIPWLEENTRLNWRLPSEAEWEYAARAGTKTNYYWGNHASSDYANGSEAPLWWPDDSYHEKTAPVGSFEPNAFGLYDMSGNALEWTEDCWHKNYKAAPTDGSAWVDDCVTRVLRGGSWQFAGGNLSSFARFNSNADRAEYTGSGFRLVLEP